MRKPMISLVKGLLFAFPLTVNAQKLDTDVASKLSFAAVIELNEVTSELNINKGRQEEFGRFFMLRDSLMSNAILKGLSAEGRKQLETDLRKKFNSFLSEEEKSKYYQKRAVERTNEQFVISAAHLKKKYWRNSELLKQFTDAEYQKDLQVNFASLLYDEMDRYAKLDKVLQEYDKVVDSLSLFAKADAYIKRKIAQLDKVKPLAEEQRRQILNQFHKDVYSHNNYVLYDVSRTVLGDLLKNPVYFDSLYKVDIARKSAKKANDLTKNYTDSIKQKVYPLVYEQQVKLNAASYISDAFVKDSLTADVNVYYKPRIDSILILYGQAGDRSKFSIALLYRKFLRLTTEQQKQLVGKVIDIRKEAAEFKDKNKFSAFKYPSFESKYLQEILSEDQFYRLMRIALKEKVNEQTEYKWNQLVAEGLVQERFKKNIIASLYDYHLSKEIANFRYIDDVARKDKNIREIEAVKPEVLKKLSLVIKNASKENTLKNSLSW